MNKRNLALLIAAASASFVVVVGLPGCDEYLSGGYAGEGEGEYGATAGGVKDMQLARDLIESGTVPPPEAFVVEGMFSEHDLPLQGLPCHSPLCLRAAGGIAPNLEGEPRGFVQVGMSSAINGDEWAPPPMRIVACVDVSGSMGWNAGDDTPGEMSRALLLDIIDHLRPEDELALVTYGESVRTILDFSNDKDAIAARVRSLEEAGSTNMEAGLEQAYALAPDDDGADHDVRVLLFTDEQPNVGATSADAFSTIVGAGADRGVALTVFGMGANLGAELFTAMAHFKGGNAFGVIEGADVTRVMDESWPFLLSPIAGNLHIELHASSTILSVDPSVEPAPPVHVSAVYGFPGAPEGATDGTIASVFLSRKHGGVLVELDGLNPGFTVDGSLSYDDVQSGETVTGSIHLTHDAAAVDERGQSFDQPSTASATALALLVTAMKDATTHYRDDDDHTAAVALIDLAAARIADDAAHSDDASLTAEADLAAALAQLMHEDAGQGGLEF